MMRELWSMYRHKCLEFEDDLYEEYKEYLLSRYNIHNLYINLVDDNGEEVVKYLSIDNIEDKGEFIQIDFHTNPTEEKHTICGIRLYYKRGDILLDRYTMFTTPCWIYKNRILKGSIGFFGKQQQEDDIIKLETHDIND